MVGQQLLDTGSVILVNILYSADCRLVYGSRASVDGTVFAQVLMLRGFGLLPAPFPPPLPTSRSRLCHPIENPPCLGLYGEP
jgi:hypothetical protein